MGMNLRFSPLEWEHKHNRFNFGGKPAVGLSAVSRFGAKEYHVKKTTDSNYSQWHDQMNFKHYDGTESVHKTITGALAVADDYDTVWVYPGEWVEAGTLNITQNYLSLKAAYGGAFHSREGTALWQLGGTDSIAVITIDGAHGVEVSGFGRIIPYNSTTSYGISIGATTECKGTWIHDNTFYAIETGTGPCHILMGASGVEAQYTLIEDNWLYCGGDTGGPTGMIQWAHATRSTIRNNTFHVQGTDANMAGIYVVDELYIRGAICDNKFWGMEQSATETTSNAIVTAGALVGGDLMIDGNHCINFNANPFSDIGVEALGLNHLTELVIANG